MKIQTIARQFFSISEKDDLPYPPSWINRLDEWVAHLPVPAWMFYLGVLITLFLLENLNKWLDGVLPLGKLNFIYVFYIFYGVFFLAAMHYLDNRAKTAFDAFRPTLAAGEAEQRLLVYQMTTMPARPVWVLSAATLIGVLALIQPVILPLWKVMGFVHLSTAAALADLLFFYINALIAVIFVYHTLRQLSWIGRIHSTITHVNLFKLRPLYSLSGLTARTAVILVIAGHIIRLPLEIHGELTTDRYAIHVGELFSILFMLFFALLAFAVFLLPLLGLHYQLQKEKERLQWEANSRLQAHIQALHRYIDAGQLQDATPMKSHLLSLSLERDILAKLPTWPWQPGTLNLILTAVLLPILLWILQQVLGRLAGF